MAKDYLTVGELVALLQTFPQGLPVVGLDGQGSYGVVTDCGVEKRNVGRVYGFRGVVHEGDAVIIQGF